MTVIEGRWKPVSFALFKQTPQIGLDDTLCTVQLAPPSMEPYLLFPVDLSRTIHTLPSREIVSDNTAAEDDSSCLKVCFDATAGRLAIPQQHLPLSQAGALDRFTPVI